MADQPAVPRSQIPAASILAHRRDPFLSSWAGGGTPGGGDAVLPHIFTVSGRYGLASKTYSMSDEALRDSRENAELMRNELAITECLEARMRSTALLNWHVTPMDAVLDARTQEVLKRTSINTNRWDAEELAAKLTLILARTPNLTKLFYCLMDAVWYGRYATEQFFAPTTIQGISNRAMVIRKFEPRHGDKLVFRYDDGTHEVDPDQIGIRVGGGYGITHEFEDWGGHKHNKVEATQFGLAYFLDKAERRRIAVHKHIIEDGDFYSPLKAGMIHGVGIRSRIYWSWYAYSECLKLLLEYLERSALGIEIWRYPAHNPKAKEQATEAAQRRGAPGRSILMVPVPEGESADLYDVQIVEPGLQGADVLQNVLDKFFGHKIKRYILGQTLTTEADATGMGSGVAQAHQATYADIVRFDSLGLAETITHDILRTLQLVNFPGSEGIWLRFAFDTESPMMDIKLNAYRLAWEMGASIKTDDIFKLLGAAKPNENDDSLTNPMLQQGMMQLQQMADQQAMMQQQQAAGSQDMLQPALQMSAAGSQVISVKPRQATIDRYDCDPTPAQIEAGNYKKGHINWQGMRITIETPKGTARHGWDNKLKYDYGYIRGTEGKDGDHVDCYLGPDMDSEAVFVIDQPTASGKRFDEHKCVLGARNKRQAREIYLSAYPAGWKLGEITAMTVDQFRNWLECGDQKQRVAEQVSRFGVQGTFSWDEEQHPRESTAHDNKRPGEFAPKDSLNPEKKTGPAGLTKSEAFAKAGGKGERLNHAQAVAATMAYLGTSQSEWSAVPVTGFTEQSTGTGKPVLLPMFEFPSGYKQVETPFTGECCSLCGTNIKNVYHIQNDSKKWTMAVGSECVTKFGEGVSGQKAAKKSVATSNRKLVEDIENAISDIYSHGTEETTKRTIHGHSVPTRVWKWSPLGRELKELHAKLKDVLSHAKGRVTAKSSHYGDKGPIDSDRIIANWHKAKGEEARSLLEMAKEHTGESTDKFSIDWDSDPNPIATVNRLIAAEKARFGL